MEYMGDQEEEETCMSSGLFKVKLLRGVFSVVKLAHEHVPSIAWWILREHINDLENFFRKRHETAFSSISMDEDGVTIICSPEGMTVLRSLNNEATKDSHKKWRALVVDVVGSAAEFPGAVYFLANTLSASEISILHISTFESEIIMVQEEDALKACEVLKKVVTDVQEVPSFLKRTKSSEKLKVTIEETPRSVEKTTHSELHGSIGDSVTLQEGGSSDKGVDIESGGTVSCPSRKCSSRKFEGGLMLTVLPCSVMLARLSENFIMSNPWQTRELLVKLLLFDERYSPKEREMAKNGESSNDCTTPIEGEVSKSRMNSFWGIWRCENEITLLLEESDVDQFPEGALIVSPQPWRIVKLSGREIQYDETGIVCAMSQVDSDMPTLNISTAVSNCTLIHDERLEQTLEQLAKSLQCPISR